MNSVIRKFIPPIVPSALRALRHAARGSPLFDGDEELFKRCVSRAKLYGEYGMGASTNWALTKTKAKIVSVDTSEHWVSRVVSAANSSDRLNAIWVDVGPLGEWGRPATYKKRSEFFRYIDGIWRAEHKPDVVLVDGRFRVAAFLHSLLMGAPGTSIIFDDYVNRPHYHVVEEFVERTEVCGRQCLFIVPYDIDRDAVMKLRDQFLLVID